MAARSGSRFQIHLSTLLLLSLEVGALLLLSFPVRSKRIWSPDPRMPDDTVLRQEWGWPYKLVEIDVLAGPPKPGEYVGGYSGKMREAGFAAVIINGIVCFLVLAFTTVALEQKICGDKQPRTQSQLRQHMLTVAILVSFVFLCFVPPPDNELRNHKLALGLVGAAFEFCLWQGITGPKLF
jgi:hypothetical protein